MTAPLPDPPARRGEAGGDTFAATVAEELPDSGDPEALPGTIPFDERSLQSLPTIGHVGRYALKYELGAGGLGTVYAALDPLLSRPIAVKTLHVDAIAEQRDALETQLLAEARAAAGLNHPHIVTVFDAGLSEQGVYIAMERLQGRDLRHLLADGWRPEPAQAARIAMRVADALAYAHGHGVIHCDIKPANIYMIGRTQPKVLDFGIARVAQQQGQSMADAARVDLQAGMSLPPGNPSDPGLGARHAGASVSLPAVEFGSPYYVAPEHQRGEPLDLRCDVYGVGVVLYELLTGQRAFQGRTLEAIRQAVLEGDVPMAHVINRNVNRELSAIVARAMARNPAQRYRSARQLARALRGWLEEEAGRQAAAPLGRSNWAWAAFAGFGLATSVAFWVVGTWHDAPPSMAAGPAPEPVVQAPAEPPQAPTTTAPVPVARPAPSAGENARPHRGDRAIPTARVRDRQGVARVAAPAEPVIAPPMSQLGKVQLAISPWGQIEVDGVAAGTTPPLSQLTLPTGTHRIVVRNDDFPPYTTQVTVIDDKPVTLRHRFGS
jgi:serine/threonine-protein kinase